MCGTWYVTYKEEHTLLVPEEGSTEGFWTQEILCEILSSWFRAS